MAVGYECVQMSYLSCIKHVKKRPNFESEVMVLPWEATQQSALCHKKAEPWEVQCEAMLFSIFQNPLTAFFLCEFLFQKKRTSDCFCVDMPSIRFGLGSSSFGCGAAVGFPDPSFRGERPPDRISRWVWASLGDLGDTWKLWICQVLLSPFVVSRPRRTHWKSSIREIRITWRDTQLLVVPGT